MNIDFLFHEWARWKVVGNEEPGTAKRNNKSTSGGTRALSEVRLTAGYTYVVNLLHSRFTLPDIITNCTLC